MELDIERPVSFVSRDGVSLDARVFRAEHSRGTLLLVHGFSVDLHEEGAFDRLVQRCSEESFSTIRFSFRGHGKSGGTDEEMTIAGERLDLVAAYETMTKSLNPPYAILAASFGAVSTLLELGNLAPRPAALVLWNPVLDIDAVFVHPSTVWGRENFGQRAFDNASQAGYTNVDGVFRASNILLNEMRLYPDNLGHTHLQGIPTLIFHGTKDSYVPLASSEAVSALPNVELIEVLNSDHGFPEPQCEERVVADTVGWINTLFEGGEFRGNHEQRNS